MSEYVPSKQHLREILLFAFNSKKSAAAAHRMLVEVYGDDALSQNTCESWFKRFKSGDLDINDKPRPGQRKKFEDAELQALLDEDDTQTDSELAKALNVDPSTIANRLRVMGKVKKDNKWVPYQLPSSSTTPKK